MNKWKVNKLHIKTEEKNCDLIEVKALFSLLKFLRLISVSESDINLRVNKLNIKKKYQRQMCGPLVYQINEMLLYQLFLYFKLCSRLFLL